MKKAVSSLAAFFLVKSVASLCFVSLAMTARNDSVASLRSQ